MNEWTLRHELAQGSLSVPRMALQVARAIAYPELDVADEMNRFYLLAAAAADVVSPASSMEEQGQRLSTFLFDEVGFGGNVEDYSDPRNSYLNEVFNRRLGIPITLSIIYTFVAQEIGIPAYGIALPGHFIVGIHDEDMEHWFDPFNGGRQLSLVDCALLVRSTVGYEGPLEAAWFAPAPPREIIGRLLNNLRIIYVRSQQWNEALAVISQLRLVQPAVPEHLRDLGLIYYRQRDIRQAAHYLNLYLRAAPEAADAGAIRDGMSKLLDEWARQN